MKIIRPLLICIALLLAMLFAVSCGCDGCEDSSDTTTATGDAPPAAAIRKLNGVLLGDWRIVYPHGDSDLRSEAERLATSLKESYEATVLVVSDEVDAERYEILVGDTSHADVFPFYVNEYGYYPLETKLILGGSHHLAVPLAIDQLIGDIAYAAVDGGDFDFIPDQRVCELDVTALRIMSFNVKVSDITSVRQGGVISTIRKYNPDLIGIQEANGTWMKYLSSTLSDDYASVFLGREGNDTSEGTPVFYNKHKFELLSSGTKWLSDTPDVSSKISSSICKRVITYAELNLIETGERVIFVSAHLDHGGDSIAVVQAMNMKKILTAAFGESAPIFIVGDFNVLESSDTYRFMVNNFGMTSASDNAAVKDDTPTYYSSSKKIDFCFYFDRYAEALDYGVIQDKYAGEYPSDHYAIYADLYLK